MIRIILYTSGVDNLLTDQFFLISNYLSNRGEEQVIFLNDDVCNSTDCSFAKTLESIDDTFFNDSDLFLPVDDLFSIYPHICSSSNLRVHFYLYDTYSVDRLKKYCCCPDNRKTILNELFTSSKYFVSNYCAIERASQSLGKQVDPVYLPLLVKNDYDCINSVIKDEINIAWVGPINKETLNSFVALCDDIVNLYDQYGKINIHIMEGSNTFWKIDFLRYASKIDFIFPNSTSIDEKI